MQIFKPGHKLVDTYLSETLRSFLDKPSNEKTKIQDLLSQFQENSLLLAIIIFSLPVAIPLPYPPGFTTIFGMPLIILSFQMLMGYKQVKLPKKFTQYQLKNSLLIMMSQKILPTIIIVEKYTKRRLSFSESVYCEQFIGFISIICSISVSLPIPFTNAIPALGISVMSLGLINKDGLVIIAGVLISIIGVIIALLFLILGVAFMKYLYSFIF
ncbi:MAG: exopolysaccharide biosynthesis protein [Rickettsiaceae bacterium]